LSDAAATDALLVLAGGRSSRFGSDKALAELEGEALALRALRRLAPLAPLRVLVRAAPIAGLPAGVRQLADPAPGGGPLQALRAAFAALPGSRCFVAPCDAPELEPSLYAPLAAAAGEGGVACARHGERLEPLVAVWSARAAARFAAAPPAAGDGEAMHRALARAGAVAVDFAAADPRFRNVNTRVDLERSVA
jgi:molybdopterin-guanine dinucleotide biosynthesis protein A